MTGIICDITMEAEFEVRMPEEPCPGDLCPFQFPMLPMLEIVIVTKISLQVRQVLHTTSDHPTGIIKVPLDSGILFCFFFELFQKTMDA